ncbi:hypothetical protein DFH06DRAFT_1473288 [Mycena polygramma]|nr:hypothetical protein DFH06DRAFT_1473288 [Mycena polygramma]
MHHWLCVIIFAALLTESYAVPINSRTPAPATLPTTQYHVTCGTAAASIQKQMTAGVSSALRLGPARRWPDEFTWSGGFYLTPSRANAEAFGLAFKRQSCATKGGLVTLEFTFDMSSVNVKALGDTGSAPQTFMTAQKDFGDALRAHLTKAGQSPTLLWSPSIDDGLDLNPTAKLSPGILLPPTSTQIIALRKDATTGISPEKWAAYDALAPYDVVTGAVPLAKHQQQGLDFAVTQGMPPIQPPFEQVVLVTNTAVSQLKYKNQYPLNPPSNTQTPGGA